MDVDVDLHIHIKDFDSDFYQTTMSKMTMAAWLVPVLSWFNVQSNVFSRAAGMQESSGGAKLDHLIKQLTANEATNCSSDHQGPPIKSVIFSQFKTMLTLVEVRLKTAGIAYVRVDGSVAPAQRAAKLKAFASATPDAPRVAVVSLKACGVGLNLVSASQVHLLDPWWNPTTEDQAMDRVHRIGQQATVRVFRYISRDTIEERMLELQNRKRELAERAFERRRPEDQQAARLADIKLLMCL